MPKIEILKLSENLVERTGDIVLSSVDISNNMVVFPNRRPGYFLNRYLYEKKGNSFQAPLVLSIDAFIDWAFDKLFGNAYKNASDLDLIEILYKDFAQYSRDITGIKLEYYTLDFFMPWAFKLLSDFEDLKINRVEPGKIKDFDYLISEENEKQGRQKSFDSLSNKYARFSELYDRFYTKCISDSIYTRSMKYEFVAGNISKLELSIFDNVIFAGFFALTDSEKDIFEKIYTLENVYFMYLYSPLLKKHLPFNVEISDDLTKSYREDAKIEICKTGGPHEQIMNLNLDLEKYSADGLDHKSAIILPDSNMILPVIGNILCKTAKFNISAGYPLKMTPIYSMLEALFTLLESGNNDYVVRDYLNFVMHPYVKNINTAGSAEKTRKLFQSIKSEMLKRPFKSRISLSELESLELSQALKEIHDQLIRPFEEIENIGDFAEKLIFIVDYISKNSTAKRHPYWNYFPGIVSEKLREVSLSRLATMSFGEKTSYFNFVRTYLAGSTHPFRGSPVEGLQCLGFLESRNLKFENLFVLDVNDGILPSLKKEDTILPFNIREKLGLATYHTAAEIYSYYFENLVFSAKKVYLYYVDDKYRESSPLIEKIKWELEKKGINAERKTSVLRINFGQINPESIRKTFEIKNWLAEKLVFSYSSINLYLQCQLAFYYQYVLRLKEEVDMEIDNNKIGILFHEILSSYFSSRLGQQFSKDDLEYEKKLILEIAERVIQNKFSATGDLEDYIIKSQIRTRLKDFIDFNFSDGQILPEVKACEKKYYSSIRIQDKEIQLVAKIDRIDNRLGETYLVDYKTSANEKYSMPSQKLEEKYLDGDIRNWGPDVGSLQLPIYIMVYSGFKNYDDINASIITLGSRYIKETKLFNSKEEKKDKMMFFYKVLERALAHISQADEFLPPLDEKPCSKCSYKTICGRQWVKKR